MCGVLVWSLDTITGLSWPEIIKAAAAAGTAFIALIALKNWQRQDKAKRHAEFLDQLIDATHTYIADMAKPITLIKFVHIKMESHSPTCEGSDKSIMGAIAYIDKLGVEDAKRLLTTLEAVQPSTIRLRSLVAKGQVFMFDDYTKCQDAVSKLTWQFDRLEAVTAFIGSPPWNWENPEVLSHLKNVIAIGRDDISKSIEQNNVAILEFVKETYKNTYN